MPPTSQKRVKPLVNEGIGNASRISPAALLAAGEAITYCKYLDYGLGSRAQALHPDRPASAGDDERSRDQVKRYRG